MKKFILFVLFFVFSVNYSFADNLKVGMAPQGKRLAERLMSDICDFFNEGDIENFSQCFEKKSAVKVKAVMKNVINLGIHMKIMSVNVTEENDKIVKFDVVYTWDNKEQTRTTFAEVLAEFVEKEKLLVKSEKITNFTYEESIHKEKKKNEFLFGGGGQVVFNPRSNDLLPLDIPQVPGGCADGKCGIR